MCVGGYMFMACNLCVCVVVYVCMCNFAPLKDQDLNIH